MHKNFGSPYCAIGTTVPAQTDAMRSTHRRTTTIALPILIATLPLPPSINEQYATDFRTERRFKTEKAEEFWATMQGYLNHPEAPYTVWTDSVGLAEVRAKAAQKPAIRWLQKPRYSLTIQFVFANDRRDIDGGLKILVDTLANWLELNDNRYWQLTLFKSIDATFPHVELVMRPNAPALPSGATVTAALEEVQHLEGGYGNDETTQAEKGA